MADTSQFEMIVEWSDEDQTFVGSCPGVIGPSCHGMDEKKVHEDLSVIVEEWNKLNRQKK